MTALSFVFVVVAGAVWFNHYGPFLMGGVTIYPVLFLITLTTASIYAYRSNSTQSMTAAVALILHFIAHQIVWATFGSYWSLSLLYFFFAYYFLFTSIYRWQVVLGGIYLLCSSAGFFNWLGLVGGHEDRSFQFIDFTYPDVIALLGHAGNVILGMGSGDIGTKVRSFISGSAMEPTVRLNHLSSRVFRA
ncbi:hypothetical protein [Cohaesibacter gelatinilyticus]|uniref:Uncharacterized protein n=1 Tax=Cohaesibacter gelatinilyticus TaxID=372072 RepID=A0A285PP96_9HYPH|nr:hypothetical protein [Cohaesibacter gelatinilyticus]SNZ21741.1 hypothetical protein SAMN06265368_4866 [Cohaesibacter gelatinilyticus]